MSRRQRIPMAGWAAVAALLLAMCYALLPSKNVASSPKSLRDAEQIALMLGLHCRSDNFGDAVTIRLVISSQPLTFERANHLRIGEPDHPSWQGTVAACAPWQSYIYLADPSHGVVWGDVFLYGDPALIRALMAAAPVKPQRNASR